MDVAHWGDAFHRATSRREVVPRPLAQWPELSLDEAYAIQAETISRRVARGDRVKAVKLGLTQQAEQDQWSIPHPTFGTLTESMLLSPGHEFSVSSGLQPKVEAEIVVITSQDIRRPVESVKQLVDCLGLAYAGIEILDSRYADGQFHPIDAVADNQSALSGVWSMHGVPLDSVDIAAESATLTVNGDVKGAGNASRILGNPLIAVMGAVNEMLRLGREVPSGLAIFSGNLCQAAVPVSAGDKITVSFSQLGSLSVIVIE